MSTDKIGPQHLRRKAILYVRQSSTHQVLHNRESGALQYAMRDRLTALGFTEIDCLASRTCGQRGGSDLRGRATIGRPAGFAPPFDRAARLEIRRSFECREDRPLGLHEYHDRITFHRDMPTRTVTPSIMRRRVR